MSAPRTRSRSAYMEWAKLRSGARYNLAASGIMSYPLSELPVRLEDLEINGPTVYGYGPLQERLARKNGVSVENVVAATGTSMANHLAMAATLEPGDEVLVEEPTYELLLSAAAYLGATIRRFPRRFEDDFRINPDDVARQITPHTRLVVITNLHNPSGALTDTSTLTAIGEIARSVGARVLVDEVYLESVLETSIPSSFHLGGHFIVTSSLTKAYGLSGLRCGWVLSDPELAERMWKIDDLFGSIPAHVAELLSVIALDNLERIAGRARDILKTNRQQLNALLDSRTDLECFRPEFGTVMFPRLRTGSVDEFCSLLSEKYETSVVPGRFFEMRQHFRVGIVGDEEMTREGLSRLARALDEFSGA